MRRMDAGGIDRNDPFGGSYGSALGVRAGDFVFTTVAGVEALEEGEPVFGATFDRQLALVGEHLARRLQHFDCGVDAVVDATVWVHPSVEIEAPGLLLDALQHHVFHGVMPTISFILSPMLYPEALVGVKVMAFAPASRERDLDA
jgi:enamine deaminase RidA (YjgF/YER057c/UK114 family)